MDNKFNPKAGVSHTGFYSSEKSHLAWTSMYMNPKGAGASKTDRDAEALRAQQLYEGLGKQIEQSPGQDLGIWKEMNPGTWFNTNPQQAIQTMKGLKSGDEIIAFDFETLGTFFGDKKKGQMDFGTITEMAFGRYRLNDKLLPEHVGNVQVDQQTGRKTFMPSEYGKHAMSVLVQPNTQAQAQIQQLIERASGMGRRWTGFTKDEYRTLNDLILYSDSKNLKDMNGMTFILGQNRQAQALDGSIFRQEHIQAMKKGFKNLQTRGTGAENLVTGLDRFFYEHGNGIKKLAGFNTQNFDVPIFKEFLSQHILPQLSNSPTATAAVSRMMKDLQSAQNIDLYQAVGVVNKNLRDTIGPSGKQHNIAKNLGIQFTDAHFGLDDLQLTMDIWGKLGKNFETTIHNSSGKNSSRTVQWNSDTIKPGDRLFAVSGIASNQASPLDMVYKKTKNGFVPAYGGSFKPNPISKNTHYVVDKMVKDMEHEGKKYSGVMLHNLDDDLFHFIANEDEHKLRSVFQQNFVDTDSISEQDRVTGKKFTQMDRTRRGWDKMFETGGVDMMDRMLSGLDALQEGRRRWGGRKGGDKQIAHYVKSAMSQQYGNSRPFKGSDKMYKDLLTMEGRLVQEAPALREFVKTVKADEEIAGNRHLQGIAANFFRQRLDEEIGSNVDSVRRGSHVPILGGLNIDGNESSINLRNQDTIQKSIMGIVSKDVGGKAPAGVTRTRLKALLGELKAKGMFGTTEYRKRMQGYEKAIENIGNSKESKEQAYMLYRQISADIEEAHRLQKLSGVTDTIDVENPTKMVSEREKRLAATTNLKRYDIVQESIQHARLFSTQTYNTTGGLNTKGTPLVDIARAHDTHMQRMFDITGLEKNGQTMRKQSAMSSLSTLANAYKTGDTEVAFIASEMGGDKKKYQTLHMVVANKADAEKVFKLKPNEIIQSEKVFSIPIPILNSPTDLVMPGNNGRPSIKFAQLSATQMKDGIGFGTGFDTAVQKAIHMSGYARGLIGKGESFKASSVVTMQIKDSINNLSSRALTEDLRGSDSKARNWSLSGMINVGAYAEEWYKWNFANDPKKDINKIYERMEKKEGSTFLDSMSGQDQLAFQRGIDKYMNQVYQIRTHTHSTKGAYVSKHVRSTRDVRELTPFGFANPTARDDLTKSINYKAMDTASIREGLRGQGYSESDIERFLSRGLVTDTALNELERGDKLAYLNVRSASMHSTQLSKIYDNNPELQRALSEANINPARLTTYDGNFLIRESVANSMQVTRESRIKLEENHILDPKIAQLFEGMKPDENGVIRLSEKVDLAKLMGGTNIQRDRDRYTGKKDAHMITVGWMEKEGVLAGEEKFKDAVAIKSPGQHMEITGFDQRTNQLIYDTVDRVATGTKVVTDIGDRSTVGLIVPDKIMDMIAPNADTIMEEIKLDRGKQGVEAYRLTGLVIDEARRKQATVGKMHGSEVLDELEKIMRKHFKLNDDEGGNGQSKLLRQGDQFILSSVFGLDGEKVNQGQLLSFLAESSDRLGIDSELLGISYQKDHAKGTYTVGDSKSGIAYGQSGLAIGNVYNWERSVGPVSNFSDGLVNWGIKEVDVITAKANQALTGVHADKAGVVKSWLSDHMNQAIEAQGGKIHADGMGGYTRGLATTARFLKGEELPTNIPIIRTSGNNFEGSRVVDGRVELSMNTLEDIPQFRTKRDKTVQDYQRTLIMAGDADAEFGKALKESNGVFAFELPEGFGKSHVTMLDTNLIPRPGTDKAMLNDIQQSQATIWNKVNEYHNISPNASDKDILSVEKGLERAISAHEEVINRALVSSDDGGLVKKGMTAKMDMAGQFRIQGVNPLINEKAKNYKEGTLYVNEDRFFEMIGGKERHIMQEVMGYSAGDLEKMEYGDMRKRIVDWSQTEGLYGFTNRYPTIDKDTIQALRVEVDNSLTNKDRGAYTTVGTAMRLKADYDGDFLSVVMAQYKGKYASQMHEAMGVMNEFDTKRFEDTGRQVMQDIDRVANERGVTPGSLVKDGEFMKMYEQEMLFRTRDIDDLETLQARMGVQYVGQFDNTRHKLLQLANDTYSILEGNQQQLKGMFGSTAEEVSQTFIEKRDKIAEFGRILSQDTISAKKWSIATTQKQILANASEEQKKLFANDSAALERETVARMEQRVTALSQMQNGLRKMGSGGMQDILEANEILGLFKSDEKFDEELEAIRNHPKYATEAREGINGQRYKLSDMLGTLSELYNVNGDNAWIGNTSLTASLSKGTNEEATAKLMNLQQEDQLIGTDYVHELERQGVFAEDGLNKRLTDLRQYRANSVVARATQAGGMDDSIIARPQQISDGMLGGEMMASRAGATLSDVSSQFLGPNLGVGKIGAVAGWGAAVFGGLWASSALMRSGPTPEQTSPEELEALQNMPVKNMGAGPTARITPQSENINIQINAKDAKNMGTDQVTALVQQEINAMMNMDMNMNVNVSDNSQQIDREWLQGVVARSINGFAF